MNIREQKGKEIASRLKIERKGDVWIVPSQTGKGKYTVDLDIPLCSCPDLELRGLKCKHIYAVEYSTKHESDTESHTTTVTKTVRVTYKQDWPAYNMAQTNEKAYFQSLLRDLCKSIEEPPQTMGRSRLPLRDMVFSTVFKVYSTVSTRRFICDLQEAYMKGYISSVPHFNSILNYMDTTDLTSILRDVIRSVACLSRPWKLILPWTHRALVPLAMCAGTMHAMGMSRITMIG